MIAPVGPQRIVRFAEVRVGQYFASTKTGRHYIKTNHGYHRAAYDGRQGAEPETFLADTLVYVDGIMPEQAL